MPFSCDRCAHCCRYHRVPLTAADLQRLVTASAGDPESFTELLASDEVEMTGEPESFAELPGGRRLLVLKQTHDACIFLDEAPVGGSCRVHDARPLSCRAYPFDRPEPRSTGPLGLHPEALCPPSTGINSVVSASDAETEEAAERVARRDLELSQHAQLLQRWNQSQRLRRQLHKPRLDRSALFRRLLSAPATD